MRHVRVRHRREVCENEATMIGMNMWLSLSNRTVMPVGSVMLIFLPPAVGVAQFEDFHDS